MNNQQKAIKVLSLELKSYFEEHYGQSMEDVLKKMNTNIQKRIEQIRNDLVKEIGDNKTKQQKYLEGKFISNSHIDHITEPSKYKFKKIINLDNTLGFVFGWRKPKHHSLDAYCMLLGGCGFLEFMNRVNVQDIPSNTCGSPMEDHAIREFFQNDCRLYVYSEDMEAAGEETKFMDLYYPKIDGLVLSYSGDNQFILKNLPSRTDHEPGIIEWISGNSKNSFQIHFPNSPRKLNIRFCLPAGQYINDNMDLMVGLFMITNEESGKVQAGLSVLLRNQKNSILEPYQYDPLDEDQESPSKVIIEYLYDRYISWIKTPGKKIYDINSFNTWLNGKSEKHYSKRRPIENKFLVTFPITSFNDTSKFQKMEEELSDTFFDFTNNYYVSRKIHRANKNSMSKLSLQEVVHKIDQYLGKNKNKIKLFPKTIVDIENIDKGEKINTDLFFEITHSLNIVFVIPGNSLLNGEEDNSGVFNRVSSIYTIIGYCLALRRNTFILCEDVKDLPLILQEDIPSMKLRVWPYSSLKEIPFLFYYKMKTDEYD